MYVQTIVLIVASTQGLSCATMFNYLEGECDATIGHTLNDNNDIIMKIMATLLFVVKVNT